MRKKTDPTPAGKASKRTEVAERRQQVASLALAYVPQYQIAERLNVSAQTVSNDIAAIRMAWLEDAKQDVQILAMRELASLDRLESRLWQQFAASSLSPDQRARTAGQILRCKERRAKMLGFDQPDLLQITVSDERLEAEVIELREALGVDSRPRLEA